MSENKVDLKAQVVAMTCHYKSNSLRSKFVGPPPDKPHETQMQQEIDPRYVSVQLYYRNIDEREYLVALLLETETAKALNLMVGDKITLKLVKENDQA